MSPLARSVVVALLATGCTHAAPARAPIESEVRPEWGHPQPGDLAPPFTLPSLSGGNFSLASKHGSWVLVHFMETWRASSDAETASIGQIVDKFASRGLTVVLVDVKEPLELWRAYARSQVPPSVVALHDEVGTVAASLRAAWRSDVARESFRSGPRRLRDHRSRGAHSNLRSAHSGASCADVPGSAGLPRLGAPGYVEGGGRPRHDDDHRLVERGRRAREPDGRGAGGSRRTRRARDLARRRGWLPRDASGSPHSSDLRRHERLDVDRASLTDIAFGAPAYPTASMSSLSGELHRAAFSGHGFRPLLAVRGRSEIAARRAPPWSSRSAIKPARPGDVCRRRRMSCERAWLLPRGSGSLGLV